MKLLLANKLFYHYGGAETSFFETMQLLEQKEHHVVPFSMKHPINFYSRYEKYFVSHVDYESKKLYTKIRSTLRLLYSFEARKKSNI
jgi:hypothetical protein